MLKVSTHSNLQCVFENYVIKLNIYQGDCWVLANSLETYSPGKYLSTKICYKNSVPLVVSCFFPNENPLGLLRGSETAVWASLKSNIL